MTRSTENFSLFSDLHKDARGFRPRGRSAERFLALTEAEQEKAIDEMASEVREAIANDEAAEEAKEWRKAQPFQADLEIHEDFLSYSNWHARRLGL